MQCVLGSMALGIGVEWGGMLWWWPGEGSGHARAVMLEERGYLGEDFQVAAGYVGRWVGQGYYWAFEWTRIEAGLTWLGGRTGLAEFVRAALYQVQILLWRLCTLAVSAPVFVLFGVVGVCSGLAMRDVRRWSAGREFGAVYHGSKRWAPRLLALAAVVYLTIPTAVHPTSVIVPGAAVFGAAVWLVAASFKKYL